MIEATWQSAALESVDHAATNHFSQGSRVLWGCVLSPRQNTRSAFPISVSDRPAQCGGSVISHYRRSSSTRASQVSLVPLLTVNGGAGNSLRSIVATYTYGR